MAYFAAVPVVRFYDNNNVPLRGGLVSTCLSGTSTPQTTFTDSTGMTANTNPIVLNSRGEASVWLPDGLQLKFVVTDANGNPIQTLDPVAAPIPSFLQVGTGSVRRTIQDRLQDSVDVFDFMTAAQIADARTNTGAIDATTSIQAALNSGFPTITFPAGTFKHGALTIPSTVKQIIGAGIGATLLFASGSYPNYVGMFTASNLTGLEISGFSASMDPTVYTLQSVIVLNSITTAHIHDLDMPNSGFSGISASSPVDVRVERVHTANWLSGGISFQGVCQRCSVAYCYVPGTGTQTYHNIQVQGGAGHTIQGCYTTNNNAGHFGVNLYQATDSTIVGNICFNGTAEGINAQDVSNVTITGNSVFCSASSADFGISLYGDNVSGGSVSQCVVSGNVITKAGKAGIALAGKCSDNLVTGNAIYQCNGLGQSQWGGVTFYGNLCSNNTAQGNYLFDDAGNMKYAVAEWNDGTGYPTGTRFIDNTYFSTGGLTSEFFIGGTNAQVWSVGWTDYVPTFSSTATINVCSYRPQGKTIELQWDVTLTAAPGGSFTTTLPPLFPSFSPSGGILVGANVTTGGHMLRAMTVGTTAAIVGYDNTSPGTTGDRLVVTGSYRTT